MTQTPKPAPVDGPIVLDADAPEGADPQLSYLDGVQLVDSAGNVTELGTEYWNIARAGNEYLATRYGDPYFSVDVLDAEGKVLDTSEAFAGAVSSADGTVGAWVTPEGKVMTRFEGRTVELDTVTGGSVEAVEIVGGGPVHGGRRRLPRVPEPRGRQLCPPVGGLARHRRRRRRRPEEPAGGLHGRPARWPGHPARPRPGRPGVQRGLRRAGRQAAVQDVRLRVHVRRQGVLPGWLSGA